MVPLPVSPSDTLAPPAMLGFHDGATTVCTPLATECVPFHRLATFGPPMNSSCQFSIAAPPAFSIEIVAP